MVHSSTTGYVCIQFQIQVLEKYLRLAREEKLATFASNSIIDVM